MRPRSAVQILEDGGSPWLSKEELGILTPSDTWRASESYNTLSLDPVKPLALPGVWLTL